MLIDDDVIGLNGAPTLLLQAPYVDVLGMSISPGFPMWDELAAMVWLDPAIVTKQALLHVDFETSMTAGYGDTLSWSEDWRSFLEGGSVSAPRRACADRGVRRRSC